MSDPSGYVFTGALIVVAAGGLQLGDLGQQSRNSRVKFRDPFLRSRQFRFLRAARRSHILLSHT